MGTWSCDQFSVASHYCPTMRCCYCPVSANLRKIPSGYLSVEPWRTTTFGSKVCPVHYHQILSEMQKVMCSLFLQTVKLPVPFFCMNKSTRCSCAVICKKTEQVTWRWRDIGNFIWKSYDRAISAESLPIVGLFAYLLQSPSKRKRDDELVRETIAESPKTMVSDTMSHFQSFRPPDTCNSTLQEKLNAQTLSKRHHTFTPLKTSNILLLIYLCFWNWLVLWEMDANIALKMDC